MIVDPILGLFFFLALSTAHFCQVLGLEMTTRRLVVSCWRIMLVVWRSNGRLTCVMEEFGGSVFCQIGTMRLLEGEDILVVVIKRYRQLGRQGIEIEGDWEEHVFEGCLGERIPGVILSEAGYRGVFFLVAWEGFLGGSFFWRPEVTEQGFLGWFWKGQESSKTIKYGSRRHSRYIHCELCISSFLDVILLGVTVDFCVIHAPMLLILSLFH